MDSLPLPNSSTFSQKCRELIGIGIKEVEQKLVRNKGEVTFIDLFSGLEVSELALSKHCRNMDWLENVCF